MTTGAGTSIYLVPPATANGPLHVGHLSGPYLAVDMAYRAALARGENAVLLGGIDTNQNWILMRAEQDGLDVDKVVESFHHDIVDAYRAARLDYDAFVDPTTTEHQHAVARLADDLTDDTLQAAPITVGDTTLLRCPECHRTMHHAYVVGACPRCGSQAMGGGCEGCGGYTCADNLIDAECSRCGCAPETFTTLAGVLDLERHRDYLTTFWERTPTSDRARQIISDYLAAPLPSIPVAYPTDFGSHGSGRLDGLRLDVYLEVGLGTVYGSANALRSGTVGLEQTRSVLADSRIWHFNGIDNAFYVLLFWPVVYRLAGAQTAGAVTNEFYTLDGSKFSTSRNHAIWVNDFLSDEDVDLVRCYLAWDRPDRYGSDFTEAAYREFVDYAGPLLAGQGSGRVSSRLAEADVRRGLAALNGPAFDPPLAARCLLSALDHAGPVEGRDALRTAIVGR